MQLHCGCGTAVLVTMMTNSNTTLTSEKARKPPQIYSKKLQLEMSIKKDWESILDKTHDMINTLMKHWDG
jgi:hypothetical protein